jgi:hypothetical protein
MNASNYIGAQRVKIADSQPRKPEKSHLMCHNRHRNCHCDGITYVEAAGKLCTN